MEVALLTSAGLTSSRTRRWLYSGSATTGGEPKAASATAAESQKELNLREIFTTGLVSAMGAWTLFLGCPCSPGPEGKKNEDTLS